MDTVSNTAYLADAGDGWAFSGSLRHAAKSIQDWALADEDWQWNADHTAWTKSKFRTRYITTLAGMGTPFKRGIKEKIIVRWSAANASKDAMTRVATHYAQAERAEPTARHSSAIGHPELPPDAERAAVLIYNTGALKTGMLRKEFLVKIKGFSGTFVVRRIRLSAANIMAASEENRLKKCAAHERDNRRILYNRIDSYPSVTDTAMTAAGTLTFQIPMEDFSGELILIDKQ
jgi:hypothetical protein